jgi:hypothetical protein
MDFSTRIAPQKVVFWILSFFLFFFINFADEYGKEKSSISEQKRTKCLAISIADYCIKLGYDQCHSGFCVQAF